LLTFRSWSVRSLCSRAILEQLQLGRTWRHSSVLRWSWWKTYFILNSCRGSVWFTQCCMQQQRLVKRLSTTFKDESRCLGL
jgi:hypothetical protein